MTPEERALGVMLAFPVRNTEGQAEAMQRYIAEQFAAAIAEEREACAKIADTMDVPDCRDACAHEYPNNCVAAAIRARSSASEASAP